MGYADLLVITLLITAIIILIVALLLFSLIKLYANGALNTQPFASAEEKEKHRMAAAEAAALIVPKAPIWNRLMGLKPLSEESDLVMEHTFDGIAELDNPTPRWFMVLFFGSIIFAAAYLLNYEVLGFGLNQDQEYAAEIEQAAIDKQAFLMKPENAASAVNENNIELVKDEAVIKQGAALFSTRCTPCHGAHAEGIVGPNLTDEFWLHGGTVKDVFKVIKYGVPEKGMVSWEKSMSAQQIAELTNYVLSLQGSKPANPKAPQGDKQL
jgi:cytochrome c oxidase cbb3-type subunit 3